MSLLTNSRAYWITPSAAVFTFLLGNVTTLRLLTKEQTQATNHHNPSRQAISQETL